MDEIGGEGGGSSRNENHSEIENRIRNHNRKADEVEDETVNENEVGYVPEAETVNVNAAYVMAGYVNRGMLNTKGMKMQTSSGQGDN